MIEKLENPQNPPTGSCLSYEYDLLADIRKELHTQTNNLDIDTAIELLKWFKQIASKVRLVQEYELVRHYYYDSCGYENSYYIVVDWSSVPEEDMKEAISDSRYWDDDNGDSEWGSTIEDLKKWDDIYSIDEFMVWSESSQEFIEKEDWRARLLG